MHWKCLVASVVISLLSAPSIAAPKISTHATVLDHPGDESVGLGEVPGYVRYSVNNANKDELQDLLDLLIRKQFNSEIDGSFLVTLAIFGQGDDKPIAERTLMSGTRKSKQFLFFTTNQTDAGTIDLGGTMLDDTVIGPANNTVRISLRTYYSDKVTFDATTIQSIMKLGDGLQVAQFLAIPALASSGATAVNDFVGKILSTANSRDLTVATQLQFLKRPGESPSPNRIRLTVQAFEWEGKPDPDVTINVDIRAETKRSAIGNYDSKFVANTKNRIGFSAWAKPSKFLESAAFTLGKEKMPFFDLIEKGGPKIIAQGITVLRSGPYDADKNQKTSIGEFCNALYSLVRSGYAERDAIGIYWDLLSRLQEGLAKSAGAVSCINSKLDLFRQHGLPTDQLLASIKS